MHLAHASEAGLDKMELLRQVVQGLVKALGVGEHGHQDAQGGGVALHDCGDALQEEQGERDVVGHGDGGVEEGEGADGIHVGLVTLFVEVGVALPRLALGVKGTQKAKATEDLVEGDDHAGGEVADLVKEPENPPAKGDRGDQDKGEGDKDPERQAFVHAPHGGGDANNEDDIAHRRVEHLGEEV